MLLSMLAGGKVGNVLNNKWLATVIMSSPVTLSINGLMIVASNTTERNSCTGLFIDQPG